MQQFDRLTAISDYQTAVLQDYHTPALTLTRQLRSNSATGLGWKAGDMKYSQKRGRSSYPVSLGRQEPNHVFFLCPLKNLLSLNEWTAKL